MTIQQETYEKIMRLPENDIKLTHMMNLQYKMSDMELEVFTGKLNKDVELIEEVNKLYWMNKEDNFFNKEKFAGEGNIGHMLEQVEIYKKDLFV